MFIPLSQGKEAIVDDEDFDLVLDYGPWVALLSHGTWYALAHVSRKHAPANPRKTKIYMHRLVMGLPPEQVGHKDRNGLNNTKANLQLVPHQAQNRGLRSDNSSGFPGVDKYWDSWRARIDVNGKRIYLGYFKTRREACLVFLDAKRRYHPLTPPEWFEEMGRTLAWISTERN
jgi:hypothetical protein